MQKLPFLLRLSKKQSSSTLLVKFALLFLTCAGGFTPATDGINKLPGHANLAWLHLPSPSSSPLPLTFTLTSHLFFLFPPQSSRSPLFSHIFSASLTILLLLPPLTLLFHFFSFKPPVLLLFYRDLRMNDIPSYHHITALNIPSELPP